MYTFCFYGGSTQAIGGTGINVGVVAGSAVAAVAVILVILVILVVVIR